VNSLVILLILLSACSNVSVGGDNRYGYPRGGAVVHFPLETKSKPQDPGFHDAMLVTGQVVSVHDGDTLTVQLSDRREKVRLIGIDAPEMAQAPWGEQSRDALKALVNGRQVTLETDVSVRDQNGQLLAYVYRDGLLVNAEMVRQGQAMLHTVPPNVAHVEEYQKAQAEAREAGRGVWNPAMPLTTEPDCFRNQKKGGEC
jgi:micrococcal nuclease